MRVEIDDPEFDQAVKELAAATGEPEDISLKVAVKERLDRVTHRKGREFLERNPRDSGQSGRDAGTRPPPCR
jgi:hypothetical protein